MPSGNFQINLKSGNGNAIVEALNVNCILTEESKLFEMDYYPILNEFVLECCDLATNVSAIATAPIPDIDMLEDTKSEQAAKIHQIWTNYPKIGVQLYIDIGNGIWQKQGQPVVVQNIPFQLPINLLKPYLSSINNLKLMGKKGRLGAQVISGSNWVQLSGNDEVAIKGDWRFSFTLEKKISKPITNWFPISFDLLQNVAQLIRPDNSKRKGVIITNDGANPIYIYFGDEAIVAERTGIKLMAGDTVKYMEESGYVPKKISAMAVEGNSRLIGMEGF